MNPRREVRIPIFDLGRGAGAATIEHELARAAGVLRAHVNAASDAAYVDHEPAPTDPRRLARLLEAAGCRPGRPIEAG